MTDWIAVLVRFPPFWGALLTLVNTLVKLYVPEFPIAVWASIETVIVAILTAYGVPVAKREVAARRTARMRASLQTGSVIK